MLLGTKVLAYDLIPLFFSTMEKGQEFERNLYILQIKVFIQMVYRTNRDFTKALRFRVFLLMLYSIVYVLDGKEAN